MGIKVRCF